jgi:hypothetical protein
MTHKFFLRVAGFLIVVASYLYLVHPVLSEGIPVRQVGTRVEIPRFIEISLANTPIEFPSMSPGQESNATQNRGFPMLINITENTNAAVNLSTNATDHFRDGTKWFGVENLTYSNVSGGLNKSMLLVENTTDPFADWVGIPPPGPGNNETRRSFFWIKIPPAQEAGTYRTNITVKGSEYQ